MSVARKPHPLSVETGAVAPRRRVRARPGLWLARGLTYLLLTMAGLIAVLPFFAMLSTSLRDTYTVFTYPPEWIPKQPTLTSYQYSLENFPYVRWAINTFVVAISVTLLKLLFDSMAGFVFARRQFVLKEPLFVLILSTMMIPFAVTVIPTFFIIRGLGFLDTYQGLILPALANPVGIFMMRQFMSTLPGELEDAARIDGCGEWGIYWQVIIPLSRPALAVLAIFTFMLQWTSFIWPLLATRSIEMRTLTVGIAVMKSQFLVQWGVIMAASLMAMAPMVVLFLLLQRHFIKGLAAGALKG